MNKNLTLIIVIVAILITAVTNFTAGRIYAREHLSQEVIHMAENRFAGEEPSYLDEVKETMNICVDMVVNK